MFHITVILALVAQSMPPGMSHEEHLKQMREQAEMKKRGGAAMGFDQDKATHHFRLTKTGGIIAVVTIEAGDEATREQIREHLKSISEEFANGRFDRPVATHAEVPAGVPVMRERKALIHYAYEESADGARVVISTKDRRAREAVHAFLKYQIREHGA